MKILYPNYYKDFKCIAGKCQHSCCIGWEIDVDRKTLAYYDKIQGELGAKLKQCISKKPTPHFVLREDERCPFLNSQSLCEIILQVGEQGLCDICADHPRFRNYYKGCVEVGLGLCCEAAAELILNSQQPFAVEDLCLDDANAFTKREKVRLQLRAKMFEVMSDKTLSLEQKHNQVLQLVDVSVAQKSTQDWCNLYYQLERLDNNWTNCLEQLKNAHTVVGKVNFDQQTQNKLARLTIYFLYRHFSAATSDKAQQQAVCFAVLSTQIIGAMASAGCGGLSLEELARTYSAEIEYSDQNVTSIFGWFK